MNQYISKLTSSALRSSGSSVTTVYIIDDEYIPVLVLTILLFPYWWHTTEFMTRVIRRVTLAEQELLTLPEFIPVFCKWMINQANTTSTD